MLLAALVHPETVDQFGGGTRVLLCRPGSDFVLSARGHPDVPPHTVLLGEAQRLSLHVCEDEAYEWVPFTHPGEAGALAALAIEAQLFVKPTAGAPPVEVDAPTLGRALSKLLFDEIVSDNEIFICTHEETQLDLGGRGLRAGDVKLLAPEILVMTSLTKILVRSNQLRDKGATILCNALRESKVIKVQELDLAYNDIGPAGAKAVAAMAAVVASLTEVR